MAIVSKIRLYIQKKESPLQILFFGSVFLFAVVNIINIIAGNIPFWYDPARDVLLARDNIKDPTLIGPPTGIPGVFYGPHWIWLLSIGFLISPDPRVITTVALFLPYHIIVPSILWYLYKRLGVSLLLLTAIWVQFMAQFARTYSTQLWNPHLAALLFFGVIALGLFYKPKTNRAWKTTLSLGLLVGIMLNTHMSLGIATIMAVFLYLVVISALSYRIKNHIISFTKEVMFYILGILITLLPFFVFELKHGFMQTKVLLGALGGFGSNMVTVRGMTDGQILLEFFKRFDYALTNVPFFGLSVIVAGIFLIIRIYGVRALMGINDLSARMGLLSIILLLVPLALYLLAKNPVWSYHFVSLEVPALFLLLALAMRLKVVSYILFLVSLYYVLLFTTGLLFPVKTNPLASSNYVTKVYMVNTIRQDIEGKPYTVYAYNASIYTYDYSYLFYLLGQKNMPFDPGQIKQEGNIIYLIIPEAPQEKIDDFIEYRTPKNKYKTTKEWSIPDGSLILKREPLR